MSQVDMNKFKDGMVVHDTDLEPLRKNILDHEDRMGDAESKVDEYGDLLTEHQDEINDLDDRTKKTETATTDDKTGNAALGERVEAIENRRVKATKFQTSSEAKIDKSTHGKPKTIASTKVTTEDDDSLIIIANFDVGVDENDLVTVGGTGCLSVKCKVDGDAQDGQLIFGSRAVWRGTSGQTWTLHDMGSGEHTIEFTGELASNDDVKYTVAATHTGAMIISAH